MNEIRYFSMFTGVGGFELGLEAASTRDAKCEGKEENSRDTNGNQSISKGQEESYDSTDNREVGNAEDSDRTLLSDRQEQSNSHTRDMEEVKGDTQPRQSLRQTSDGILREGNGVRDDQTNMGFREDKSHTSKFKCVGMSEIDKYASELLKKRFPNVTNYGDCTKINPNELPDFDMLCGGFPCQAFSIAGKRRGFKDTRGTMFFEIARILEVKRPKIILLENVKGLLNHEKGETFKIILQTLDELGYRTQWMVLNSKFFGVPQNRERVFIIGSLRNEPRPEILPFRESYKESFGEANKQGCTNTLSQRSAGGYNRRGNYIVASRGRNPKNSSDRTPGNPTEQRLEKNSEGISNNLTSVQKDNLVMENANTVTPDAYLTDGKRKRVNGKAVLTSMHERRIRRLTPTECERLQGFPEGWTEGFSDTQRYRMMGNAVTVNVIKAIAETL